MRRKKETIIKYENQRVFVRRIMPAIIPIFYIVYFTYTLYVEDRNRIVEESEKRSLQFSQHLLSREFLSVHNDLVILSRNPRMARYLSDSSEETKTELIREFMTLSGVKKTYDQIRILDVNGMERISVDLKRDKPVVVSDDKLQSRGHSLYFSKTYALAENQIYVSPIDSGAENEEAGESLNPVIHFGAPLYDPQGRKQGVVILNYSGVHLFERLSLVPERKGQHVMLLNDNSYWLKGEKAEDEWGFMFKERKDAMYRKRFPSEWEKMADSLSGQFYSDTGLVTFYTLFPLREIVYTDELWEQEFEWFGEENYSWKIVSHVGKGYLDQLSLNARVPLLLLTITIILVLGLLVKKENEQAPDTHEGGRLAEAVGD